ncbi:hypothetical protein JCM17960_34970 [Magnetospira thiophila]
MKAQSVILRGVQMPLTQFGVPPEMFILVVTATTIAFGVFVAVDLIGLALIGAMAVGAVSWVLPFKANRTDPHFATLLFRGQRFWRGRPHRVLISGAPR